MKPTLNDRIIAFIALISGITISGISEYYSIMGLTAIYPAALIPIVIMGVALGMGKLSATIWIKQSWEWAPHFIKAYMLLAITLLMLITSVGVFGFLSKAHSDQALVSGDVQSKLAIYDEKIKTSKENIESSRKQIKQMDEAVDQIMDRSLDERGANKANAIRKSQQKDRISLALDIETNQKAINKLNEEAAPLRAENRKVEAEVGPIKYIAAFIYGSNPDANVLEKAVNWVSLLIVIVLDPLAIVLLLASQYNFQRFKESIESNQKLEAVKPDPIWVEDFEGVKNPEEDWVQTGPSYKFPFNDYSEIDKKVAEHLPTPAQIIEESAEILVEAVKEEPQAVSVEETIEIPVEEQPQAVSVEETIEIPVEEQPQAVSVEETIEIPVEEPQIEIPVIIPPVPVEVRQDQQGRITKVFTRPSVPVAQIEETPLAEPILAVDEDPQEPSSYVQNEEQKESNLWTTATNDAPVLQDEDHVIYLAANIRAGRMHMNEVPLELAERVKARL
jgi:energy-converting hydrogenase Eha subunit A